MFALLLRYARNLMKEKECVCPSTQILVKLYGGERVCLPFYSGIREFSHTSHVFALSSHISWREEFFLIDFERK